jgi:hypothetical protein
MALRRVCGLCLVALGSQCVSIMTDTCIAASTLIQGIQWAVNDVTTKSRVGRSTALLTIGGAKSTALNNAVASASTSGLFFAVAAGNENQDTGNTSPGSEPSACTVGGTTISDQIMGSSNYGSAGMFLIISILRHH